MKGADILQPVSAQPQALPYAWLALATAQFSLPLRLLGSGRPPDLPQWP